MSCKVIPVKVALRIRPLISKEISDGCRECIEVVPNESQVVIGSDKPFTFDFVFDTSSRQEDLYNQVVEPLMDTYFNGYNVTVLAYGQTGSGKTYSMGTCATINASNVDDEMNNAVIPRVIQEIFARIENQKDKSDFLVKVSFLEIHNEEINDLLSQGQQDDKGLAIRENTSGEIKITGLQEIKVNSVTDMAACLEQGSASRATGATAMNTRSSRSHAIFTIVTEQRGKTGPRDFKRSKFHLVDLAGSEKAKKTQATGERFKEGININKGLLALGNVISALGDEQRKVHAHVPYRDSKLTRLLQDSLGGNSNTVMIACVSPADSNMEETHNTLKYADRARKIKNKPVINRDPAAAELSKLRQQVQMLQLQLLEGQYINQKESESGPAINADMQELFERNKQLENENERLTTELHDAFDQTTVLYEKIMLVEMAKDKLKQRADQLKEKIQSRGLDISIDMEEEKENIESIDLVQHIQMKVEEMDEEEENMCTSVGAEKRKSLDEDHLEDPANSTFAAQHALRKAELCKQLQELTKALTMKEEIASKMADNDSRILSIRKQHEITVKELEHMIEKLEKEKSALNSALNASIANPSSLKKEKERLRELETKLSEYKKKQIEYQRLLKTKEQSDQKITKLDAEIRGMKQMKVKLMRQMKEEADKFRQWKLKKDKEINQLKQQDRKRLFEYKKLESVHLKQQAVLRRKTEEAAAANKRLKAALSKQKEALEKRNQSLHHQSKQSDNALERMKTWLSHEVELMVSANEARDALKEIIEDRKALSQEISVLKSKLQEKLDEPSSKRVSLGGGEHTSPKSEEISIIQKQIQDLEIDLEVRSSQIADLQQKIIDAEQGERTKYRWNNVHTMAEAKAGLKSLLSWVVESKVAQGHLIKETEDCRRMSVTTCSELERLRHDHEQKLKSIRAHQDEEILQIEKRNQERIGKLLNELEKERTINEEQKENLRKLKEVESENTSLRQRLEAFTRVLSTEPKLKKNRKSTFEPEIIELSDILLDTAQAASAKEDDLDYIPSTDGEVETPVSVLKTKRRQKKSSSAPMTKKTSRSSLFACSCKGDCASKKCKCKASGRQCTASSCKCSTSACTNRPKIATVSDSSDECVPSTTIDVGLPESKASSVKNIPGSASPRSLSSPSAKPMKSSSPRFPKPTKTVAVKSSRRRSPKYHLHSSVKKLLNTSKTTNVLTPSKEFVAPMKSLRTLTSQSKLVNVTKPTSLKNDENAQPKKQPMSS